jgi:DNA repair exonuclease SbcCD ATPase subunit
VRINSVTLRNCRLHRELKVDFDPARTLIGGPNETGKSTLIEAVHRALFLKAKGSTEHHRSLVSSLHTGHAEVDLTFEAEGNSYLLRKRFGPAGTTILAPSNSVSLSGDAAESELARLLGVEAGLTGKAVAAQWAHLWVWQGQSGDDPSTHATAQQSGLLQRLQQMGGAAALLSELDARAAKHFADAKDQLYTQAEKPKTGSALDKAVRADQLAQDEFERALDRVQRLNSAVADLENASRSQIESKACLTDLEKQQEERDSKAQQLVELRQQEKEQSSAAAAADTMHTALESAHQQILAARVEISELDHSLQSQNEAIAQLDNARQEARSRAVAAEAEHAASSDSVRSARLRRDLASAHAQLFEKAEIRAKLGIRVQKVDQHRSELAKLEESRAKLPKVDRATLKRIQRLETERSNASAALQAMATGIEVIAADQAVKAAGHIIGVGHQQILTEDTEVQIGPAVRLRIRPGGGNSLADARQAEAKAQNNLQAMLDSLGLPSVKDATEIHAQWEDLGSRINAAAAELDGMGAEDLAEELQHALNELTAAQANVERLSALVTDLKAPEDKAAAKILTKQWDQNLSEAEGREIEAKNNRDRSANVLASAEEDWTKKRTESEQQRLKLTGLNAQHDLLLKTHGDDATRGRVLLKCQAATTATRAQLTATANAIATLQPEFLEADRDRITRAINKNTDKMNEALKNIAVAKAALTSDGSEDPATDLVTAKARARSAAEHRTAVQRKSKAIALLDQLFQDEQHRLSEQFTRPLADKISGYLQCIFGKGARAQVALENSAFTGLRLARLDSNGGPFAFGTLSGGAKEQTAAAVRLAMAEVLAANHGGCLPVVFDDAFAYSDPERVNHLQRMLDLAATRGLQVIVVTCNPADYAALGAKTVSLRSHRHPSPARIHPGPETEENVSPTPSHEVGVLATDHGARVAVSDELRQALLSALSRLGGSKGNQTLRDELGWDEATYLAVKNDLVVSGRLVIGRGRGGSVAVASA